MKAKELYIGIDVSNATVDVAFLNEDAQPVRGCATYGNHPEGWVALKTAIVAATALVGKKVRVVCGMESTSNMHKRLEQALRAERRRCLEVHVLNPRAVKHFAKALLKDIKTDRVDCQLIALCLLRMQPEPQEPMPDLFEEFKEGTRTRRRFVEERTDHKNRLHKLLRFHFPGYRRTLGIRQLSKRLLVVLATWPSPHEWLDQSPETLATLQVGKRHRLGVPFAEKLHALAVKAPSLRLIKLTCMLIATTARRILELDALVAEMDRVIEDQLEAIFPDQIVTSIPGLGAVSAAAILAEVGPIKRFPNKTAFVGYCGLYPIIWESGMTKKRFQMTRKGNRMLKMTLLVASAAARQYNPIIASFYERLRARGKSTRAAGGAIARKLAVIVYTVLSRQEPWSMDKAILSLKKSESMRAAPASS